MRNALANMLPITSEERKGANKSLRIVVIVIRIPPHIVNIIHGSIFVAFTFI
jgi:hypothetical protein